MDTTKRSKFLSYSFYLLILVAAIFYSVGISHESVWYDEAYSAVMSRYPFGEILRFSSYDNHPPLFYLLLRVVHLIFGDSTWALRLLSVIGATGMIGLCLGPVKRIFGEKTAIITAVIMLFTPNLLIYAHEARMYTLSIMGVVGVALYGYLAITEERKRDWVLFYLFTIFSLYLHYFALIAVVFAHLLFLIWILKEKKEKLKEFLIGGVISALCYLPWLITFIRQVMDVDKGFWLGPVSIDSVIGGLYKPFVYKEFYPDIRIQMDLALGLSLVVIFIGWLFVRKRKMEKEIQMYRLLLWVYLLTLITTVVVSIILMPIFHPRYIMVVSGLFILLIGLGISVIPNQKVHWILSLTYVALNFWTIKDIYIQYFNYPMKALYQEMDEKIEPGDLIITSDSYSMGAAYYYFPEATHYYSNNSIEAQWGHVLEPFAPFVHLDRDLDVLLGGQESFWYISCNTGLSKNIATILKGYGSWEIITEGIEFSEEYSPVSFTITEYRFTGVGVVRDENVGELRVDISNLSPIGYLRFSLFNSYEQYEANQPFRFETINVGSSEVIYTFDGLPYGDYVLVIGHDENKDHVIKIDSSGNIPEEGLYILNFDVTQGLGHFDYSQAVFAFNSPEMVVDAQMRYP